MVFSRKKKNQHGLAALANATIKLARAQVVLDETEAALERELEKEAKSVPKTKIQKIRKKGEHLIHSKHILLMVVFLNLIDCLLVLGELMLDIKYVTDLLHKEHERSNEFIDTMKGFYPDDLSYLLPGDIEVLREEILKAHLSWDQSHSDTSHDSSHETYQDNHTVDSHETSDETHTTVSLHSDIGTTPAADNSTGHHVRRRRSAISDSSTDVKDGSHGDDGHGEEHHAEHGHSLEEDIAHGLHKASITILGILVAETFCKVFFLGKDMLDHKLEFDSTPPSQSETFHYFSLRQFSVSGQIFLNRADTNKNTCFDGVIVLASFIVDIVLLKGLQQFEVQDFVLILAFLVPWRIIRVVNSLVVAIMDHEHFRLKVLYKQKKKISSELKNAKAEIKGLEACISALETMCKGAGVPETNIKAKLLLYRKTQTKTSAMSALAGFAIGGEAMKKPLAREPVKDDHVVHVNTESSETKANESPVIPKGSVDELAKQTVITACDVIEAGGISGASSLRMQDHLRTRSYSAIEPGQGNDRMLSPNFVRKLAESSARFIATMHQDDWDSRSRSSLQLGNIEKNEQNEQTVQEKEDEHSHIEEKEHKEQTAERNDENSLSDKSIDNVNVPFDKTTNNGNNLSDEGAINHPDVTVNFF